jgi:hypothetical protein
VQLDVPELLFRHQIAGAFIGKRIPVLNHPRGRLAFGCPL